MVKRLFMLLIFFSFFFETKGQQIEYRNDSLFVNDIFVNAQTSKGTLDSLLKSEAKTKKRKSDFPKKNSTSDKKVIQTTYFYYDLGLFFRKYDSDSTKLSVGIKLYRDSDPKEDKRDELTNTFPGQLIIAGNLINYKREIEELQEMKNCTVTTSQVSIGSYSNLIGGDIIYQQNIIRLSFDSKTKQLISVYIHHNFKER